MKKLVTVFVALLVLTSSVVIAEKALGNHKIDALKCTNCGVCVEMCEFDAISEGVVNKKKVHIIDPKLCTDCGECVEACPEVAISGPVAKDKKEAAPAKKETKKK